ncbi:MAG TPA: hypothetical protein VIM84_10515, partial [Gemmatimonadales bacterium]
MDTITIKMTAAKAEHYCQTIRRAQQLLARECHPKDSLALAVRDQVYEELRDVLDWFDSAATLDQEPERDLWQRPVRAECYHGNLRRECEACDYEQAAANGLAPR